MHTFCYQRSSGLTQYIVTVLRHAMLQILTLRHITIYTEHYLYKNNDLKLTILNIQIFPSFQPFNFLNFLYLNIYLLSEYDNYVPCSYENCNVTPSNAW